MPRRKTHGYLLLVFLVLSGLAGTPTDDVLSKKERKFAADYMKETKTILLDAVNGLNDSKLNYKITPEKWSVQECFYHIAASEKTLWNMIDISMKAGPTPEKKKDLKFTDEQIIQRMTNRDRKTKALPILEPQNAGYKSMGEALSDFKMLRAAHIKYMKATSEDLRNHFVQMPFGTIDCYQLCLLISAHTSRHTAQLNEIKADPGFPK